MSELDPGGPSNYVLHYEFSFSHIQSKQNMKSTGNNLRNWGRIDTHEAVVNWSLSTKTFIEEIESSKHRKFLSFQMVQRTAKKEVFLIALPLSEPTTICHASNSPKNGARKNPTTIEPTEHHQP